MCLRVDDDISVNGNAHLPLCVSLVADTVNMEHIKRHYYMSHLHINPTAIVPLSNGPGKYASVHLTSFFHELRVTHMCTKYRSLSTHHQTIV
jgi:hypothetical protein